MDKILKEEYLHAMFRFRKMRMMFLQGSDVNMTELVVMRSIAEKASCSDDGINVNEIQKNLHITKAAISQILNSLEKKEYIVREIGKTDRRKFKITLTQAGTDVLKDTKEYANQRMEEIISRFGEKNTQQLITLLDQLSDILGDLNTVIVNNKTK